MLFTYLISFPFRFFSFCLFIINSHLSKLLINIPTFPHSYIFHLTFASSFTLLLNSSRLMLTDSRDNDAPAKSWWREATCTMLTGLLTMALAVVLQILPFYNILHDHYEIHSEVCCWLVVGVYVLIVWTGDRSTSTTASRNVWSGNRNSTKGSGKGI